MDNLLKIVVAVGGSAASFLYGGWSSLLNILLAFVIIDYVSGVIAASIEGKLSSRIGLIGIARKVTIFAIVAVSHMVDYALGDAHMFRDAAIFFFLANELISFLENAGRTGAPVPPFLKKAIAALKGKGGDNDISR
ncbi:Holin family protein [compost metagenome]